jgi:hypothetical protein
MLERGKQRSQPKTKDIWPSPIWWHSRATQTVSVLAIKSWYFSSLTLDFIQKFHSVIKLPHNLVFINHGRMGFQLYYQTWKVLQHLLIMGKCGMRSTIGHTIKSVILGSEQGWGQIYQFRLIIPQLPHPQSLHHTRVSDKIERERQKPVKVRHIRTVRNVPNCHTRNRWLGNVSDP